MSDESVWQTARCPDFPVDYRNQNANSATCTALVVIQPGYPNGSVVTFNAARLEALRL